MSLRLNNFAIQSNPAFTGNIRDLRPPNLVIKTESVKTTCLPRSVNDFLIFFNTRLSAVVLSYTFN